MKALEQIVNQFPKLINEFKRELEIAWQASVSENFRDNDGKFFNNQDKLRRGERTSGKKSLWVDISRKAKPEIKDGSIKLTYETDLPYAGIQNRGGFIKATPIQKRLKSGKTIKTYKMSQYFWSRYFDANTGSRKQIYKRMALSVQSKGGVRIKGKNYIENSLKTMEEKYLQRVLNAFFENVLRIWNAN